MARNRKLQNLIENKYMADNAVGNAELKDDAVDNAELGVNQPKQLAFLYDFAILGGDADTAYNALNKAGTGAQTIPDNALISKVHVEAITTPTVGGGTCNIAVGITGAATQFIGATAHGHATYTAGNFTALTAGKKTAAARSVLVTLSNSVALTAGKFFIWVEYYEGA